MVLPWRRGGRVGHRRDLFQSPSIPGGAFYLGLRIVEFASLMLPKSTICKLKSEILITPIAKIEK